MFMMFVLVKSLDTLLMYYYMYYLIVPYQMLKKTFRTYFPKAYYPLPEPHPPCRNIATCIPYPAFQTAHLFLEADPLRSSGGKVNCSVSDSELSPSSNLAPSL